MKYHPIAALLSVFVLFFPALALAGDHTLTSPDGDIRMSINVENGVRWAISYKNQTVFLPSRVDLKLKGAKSVFRAGKLDTALASSVNRTIEPVVKHKSAEVHEHYNQLSLRFDNGWGLEFRAFNDGIGYRIVGEKAVDIVVEKEIAEFNFPQNSETLFPEEDTFISHFERHYLPLKVGDIAKKRFASLPAYAKTPEGINIVITEADLFDYPGLFLFGTAGDGFRAGFPGVVKSATPKEGSEDRNEVVKYHKHIAETNGNRSFPWRIAVISDQATDLVESQLVYLLSRENKIEDTSWIKPGRIAWDWYNASNLYGVDFKNGLNTATYKYYIDFAAKYGLEYVILDEGWTVSTTNLLAANPELDVHELIRYGKEKNVGIILWALWKPLDKDYSNILRAWGEWGVAGIKVDFMQRADQQMVNYYTKIAKEAAKHKLLVDYHGGFKPAGLRRAYPNVMTYEGVKGNENNKWSTDVTPRHNVTLPFIRMVAGPMDFTPGAMRNANPWNHQVNHFRPMSLGTRAHQVAMYAVYESALQMLCDSPSSYLREPEVAEFIAQFPSVWDETKVLAGEVGEFIVVARRSGDTWYLGAMTNEHGRKLTVDLSFLISGDYHMQSFVDGVNTVQFAEDYRLNNVSVKAGQKIELNMASGGGWAAVLSRKLSL